MNEQYKISITDDGIAITRKLHTDNGNSVYSRGFIKCDSCGKLTEKFGDHKHNYCKECIANGRGIKNE